MTSEDFVFDLTVIDEALAESLRPSKLSDPDENIEVILPSMTQIIRELEANNHVEKSAFEPSEPAEELIDDNNLLTVNESFIVKAKGRLKRAKNKKGVMTRAEKAKAKFIKRDSFDFEHVKINLRRGDRGGRDGRDDRGDRDDRGERSSKKIKKFSAADTAAIMKTDIQAIEKASAVIDRDVQAILTRAEVLTRVGAKAKTNTSNDLIVNIDKTAIDVSSDEEFEAFTTDEEAMEEAMNMSK